MQSISCPYYQALRKPAALTTPLKISLGLVILEKRKDKTISVFVLFQCCTLT